MLPEEAIAATADKDVVSNIIKKFDATTSGWTSTLKGYALTIFKWFATFEVCWIGIRLALGHENIGDAIKQFVMFILMAGFFLAVINNYHEWSWNLINGLKGIANDIGAPAAASEAPFKAGLDIVTTILGQLSWTSPFQSLGLLITGLIVMICFALIAARMVLIKCEAMIAMTAALLLVGFGGSSLTKDYAINVIRYILSVAFKLFVMQMILAVGLLFIQEYQTASSEFQDLVVVIGAAVVLLALVASLPDTVAGIVSGSNISGGSGVGLGKIGAAMGGAALGVGVGAVAGGMAAMGAKKNLSAASKMADMAGATGLGKVGHMAKNLMSAGQEARGKNKPTRSSIMKERLETAMLPTKKD